jgi:hypothetical protein
MKRRSANHRTAPDSGPPVPRDGLDLSPSPPDRLDRIAEILLLALGIGLSVVYFNHRAVPNSDFPAFVDVARDLLHFQIPDSFKRLPVLGLLQCAVSVFVPQSFCPILTAGLIVNGILFTLSLVIFYRIGRRFGGGAFAFGLTLVAALNPYTLSMLVDPIVETSLVFFILATVYLILKRSWWAYGVATVASMTRYEGFVLIGIALLVDLICRKPRSDKFRSVGWACLAALPLVLWLVLLRVYTPDPNSNYARVFFGVEHRNGLGFPQKLGTMAMGPLLQWPETVRPIGSDTPIGPQEQERILARAGLFVNILLGVAGVFSLVACVGLFWRKQWPLVSIPLFWLAYALIHSLQSEWVNRYAVPLVGFTLLLTASGLRTTLLLAARWIPAKIKTALTALFGIVAVVWIALIGKGIPETATISPDSWSVVYIAMFGWALYVFFLLGMNRKANWLSVLSSTAVVVLFVGSNQFSLAWELGDGRKDVEFRKLAEWFDRNAEPDAKLATTFATVVQMFLPDKQDRIVHTGNIPGDTLDAFARACKSRNIVYVAWDSRIETLGEKDYYYRQWGMKKLQPLMTGVDQGPYRYLQTLQAPPDRFLHIYRLDFSKIP